MKQIRGFRIRIKLVKLINCATQQKQNHYNYSKLNQHNYTNKAITKLCKLGRSLNRSIKQLCFSKPSSTYTRIGQENPVPKGHLAVYVGDEEDELQRVLVPVVYFNHPFFEDLLKESEKVYGFNHRGGIHVPCRLSEFESLQSRICAGAGGCTRRSKLG